MSPAGELGPRPRHPDQTDEEYAAYLKRYRAELLRRNPWLTDTRRFAYTKWAVRRLFGVGSDTP